MNALMTFDDRLASETVQALVDRHGFWRVLRVASVAAWQRKARRRNLGLHVDMLSDHLRRDIGLLPRDGGSADWTLRE